MDSKFETDPYEAELHGLMAPGQYTDAMENLNRKLRRSRPGVIDGALLVAGPFILPLALWGVRHRAQTKRRKRLLKEGINEFNTQYQELLMRWNRRPQSILTIESRHQISINQNLHTSSGSGEQEETVHMVQARLVTDSGNVRSESRQGIHNPQLERLPQPQRQQQQQQRLTGSSMQQSTNRQQLSMTSPNALV